MMAKISSSFGKPTVRRAYGDWTTPQLTPWKKVLGPLGIRPHQQFHSIRGKNTSDVARVSDAMDLIHERCVDGLCIVSSDCDFLGLPLRIQAAGLLVYGFGQRACTLAGFAMACDEFVFLDDCQAAAAIAPATMAP